LASGPGFAGFVAAYYMARTWGAKLVLDYRDEWTECPFPFVKPGLTDRLWEARCLDRADAVVFTTRSQLRHQVSVFKQLTEDMCHVVPNGFEPADFPQDSPGAAAGNGPGLVVSFVGGLGLHTLPGRFLQILAEVLDRREDLRARLQIRFVGDKAPDAVKQLDSFPWPAVLKSIDHLSKPEAARLMRKSSALLILNAPGFERYVPGKLYAYLAAGPPVLLYGEGGEMGTIVSNLNAGLVIPRDSPAAVESALDKLAAPEGIHTDRDSVKEWLSAHTRHRMADRMMAVINSLIPIR